MYDENAPDFVHDRLTTESALPKVVLTTAQMKIRTLITLNNPGDAKDGKIALITDLVVIGRRGYTAGYLVA